MNTKNIKTVGLLSFILGGCFLFNYWFDNPEFRKNPASNIQFADIDKLEKTLKNYEQQKRELENDTERLEYPPN